MSENYWNLMWEDENHLWERDIQLNEGWKGKTKAELFDLYKRAAAMKQIKLVSYVSSAKDRSKLLEGKLQTREQIFRT